MRTLVIGLGVSGRAAVALLHKQGKQTFAVDRNPQLQSQGSFTWEEIEQVVISPGISPQHEFACEARRRKIEILGEAELAFRNLENRAVGITGTNGKTTTVLLIEHILKAAGKKAIALGNIGTSLCAYALHPDPEEIIVAELSSFQLETMTKKCLDSAAFLNLTPDHLDRYQDLTEYGLAKSRIAQCLKEGAKLWISKQVEEIVGIPGFRFDSEEEFYLEYDLKKGIPEPQNCQAAFKICQDLGIEERSIRAAIATFKKPAHRIEFVGDWDGIQFYNDSKATNIDAVRYAVALFQGPIILLAGGVDKGAPYHPWIQDFQGKVRRIIAFGQSASTIKKDLEEQIPVECVPGMEEAVHCALKHAKKGEAILLSPGCSSFDQFHNYEHRGNEFKRIIRSFYSKENSWIEKKLS